MVTTTGTAEPTTTAAGTVALICNTPSAEPTGDTADCTMAGSPPLVTETAPTGVTTPEIRFSGVSP